MDETVAPLRRQPDTYWLTRFMLLRWMGFVYVVAFYVAARQLVPLVGADGLTPAALFFQRVIASPEYGSWWAGFCAFPSLYWFDCSDFMLRLIPWLGVALSCLLLAGYTNAIIMTVLWIFYLSIVTAGQEWYGYGWEIQMSETGFLCIFLCPLLDMRPFTPRPPPFAVILLFRWLIVRIMLGAALIKWRGDSCWRDLTALYYHFETQPIPNPISRYFHFLPHPVLQFGVVWTFMVEGLAPLFAFWPRWGRYIAGLVMISFQFTLIVSGNLSFFNWLTILPALACFDDRFWRWLLPNFLTSYAMEARLAAKPSRTMFVTSLIVAGLVAFLSIKPVLNLVAPGEMGQEMNSSYDPLHLVNTYGAFGSVGRERTAIIFEGTNGDPSTAADWKEYPFAALPSDPAKAPPFIAPYQPHLDWQLWFAAMGTVDEYPWTLNLVYKMLHNDPKTMALFGGNPFPDHPPRYIRAQLYIYKFAPLNDPRHLYWDRKLVGPWLPPLSADDPKLLDALRAEGWLK